MLDELIPLAPLHLPHQIAAVRAVSGHAPRVPQKAIPFPAIQSYQCPYS